MGNCKYSTHFNYSFRARNSCLQTRKMRAEIQFCELKILALEKSCELNISAKTKFLSWSHRRLSKMQWKQNQAPQNTDSLSYTLLFHSLQLSSGELCEPLRCNLPVVYNYKQLHVLSAFSTWSGQTRGFCHLNLYIIN